jgi:hypothetical protein
MKTAAANPLESLLLFSLILASYFPTVCRLLIDTRKKNPLRDFVVAGSLFSLPREFSCS